MTEKRAPSRARPRESSPHSKGAAKRSRKGAGTRSISNAGQEPSKTRTRVQAPKSPRRRTRPPDHEQKDADRDPGTRHVESEVVILESGLAPNQYRLEIALSMYAAGKTQRQIAAHFGCDERTIRRWLAQAKEQGLALSNDLVPDDVVAEIVHQFLERKADLLDLKRAAEASGDFAACVVCNRELLRAEVAYVACLAKIGFFDGYRFVPKSRTDPAVEGAEQLRRAAKATLTPTTHGDSSE